MKPNFFENPFYKAEIKQSRLRSANMLQRKINDNYENFLKTDRQTDQQTDRQTSLGIDASSRSIKRQTIKTIKLIFISLLL